MSSGIYQIRNLVNGKVYVGSTEDFGHRWQQHRSCLRGGYHENSYLQHSWNKSGEANFVFEILICCEIKLLLCYEQKYMDFFCSTDRGFGYNICENAHRPPCLSGEDNANSKLTWAIAGEIREKYSTGIRSTKELALEYGLCTGTISSVVGNKTWHDSALEGDYYLRVAEVKRALKVQGSGGKKNPMFGKKHGEATKEKIKIARARQVFSEETREKKSRSMKGKLVGEKNPMHGKRGEQNSSSKLTDEQRREIYRRYHEEGHVRWVMAAEYKVTPRVIYLICKDNFWQEE